MMLTGCEQELVNRSTPAMLKLLDEDSAAACANAKPVEAQTSSDDKSLSVAQRLNARLRPGEQLPIDAIASDPSAWFSRVGRVALVATATDSRDRFRMQQALGSNALNTAELAIAARFGPLALAATRDAATVTNKTHKGIDSIALHLGMYLTAMAIGRRFSRTLLTLAGHQSLSQFRMYAESALTTSRLGASSQLRQVMTEMLHG